MARHLTLLTTGLAVLMAPLVACGEDEAKFDPNKATRIETTLSPTTFVAGGSTTATCQLLNGKDGLIAGGSFGLAISPTGPTATGLQIASTKAGTFAVACSETSLGLLDDTPSELVVTPGPAASTTLALSATETMAGVPVDATCVAVDQYGNPTTATTELRVAPTTSVTLTGASITATTAGTYEVTCASPGLAADKLAKATLTVTPNVRVGIRLTITPEALSYALLQPITVVGVAVDQYGNDLPGTVAVNQLGATPVGHHSVLGAGQNLIRFDLEGRYTISATAIDLPDQSATLDLVVDQTAPVITLTSPARGLVTDTLTQVRFAGTVIDNLGEVAELKIADQVVPVGNGGAFSVDLPLKYALNLFDVVATDPYGLSSLTTRAVERSTEFHAMLERTFAADGIENGLALVLSQEAFDDGDHTEASRDDLAHLFEFIIENIDFTSFVPNPLTTCGNGCTIYFQSVTLGDVKVTMQLMNGKLRLKVELVELAGTIALRFPCDIPVICPTRPFAELPGTMSTNNVTLETDILVSIVNGEIVTQSENTEVTIDGLDVNINDPTGLAQALITGAVTFIRPALILAMETLLESLIADQLTAALGGLFGALKLDQEFDLPSVVDGQAPNTIVLKTEPRAVDIGTERLQIRVDAIAYPKVPKRPHEHLGSLGHRGCAPPSSLTFPPVAPIVVGLHDDFINQLLFAVWEGGTLDLDLGPEESAALVGDFGLQDATVKVDALLPPVLDSCQRDNTVQIGDLYLEFEADFLGQPTKLGIWLQAEAGVGVLIAPDETGALVAKLELGEFDPLLVDVVINEGAFAADDQLVVDLVNDVLIPQLLGTVTESASFTLPSFDLGELTSAVPAGTIINIDVRKVGRDNAYLTVEGALK